MTYRDDLERAHERIAQLEEELEEERAKNAPPVVVPEPLPEIRLPPTTTSTSALEWWEWWPIPVLLAGAIACFIQFKEPALTWVARSGLAGGALMTLDAIIRNRNAGDRTLLARLLLVAACIVGAPALLFAFIVGGPVVGIGFGVVAAIAGVIALVRWVAKGGD